MTDQPRTLGGRYRLGRVIGRGGMALVSAARDLRLGREVAIKELRIDLAGDPTFQARFRREAQAAAGLNHPNIVAVYDTGEEMDDQGRTAVPYIVMELVEGRTLRDLLREGRPLLPQRALEFTVGILDALEYSHRAGIVHRDIKPANVMLTTGGTIKVMDFGIARAVSDTSSTMTQTAAVIGTAQYLSPEQARGETVDARSDIYSAGCLMYELLVGRPPFQGDSPVSVAYQHVREQPVPPSQLDQEVTAPMDAVVLKALAKDPADRYASAAAMREDVERILKGDRVEATLPPPVPPLVAQAAGATAATSVMPLDQTLAGQTMGGTLATGDVPAVEPRRRSRAGLWWTLAVLGVVLVGLVAGFLLLNQPRNPPAVRQVAVPAGLHGQAQVIAENIVKDAGLKPRIIQTNGPAGDTVNRVTDVRPVSGTLVDEGTTIDLTVNIGPEQRTVPDGLTGKSVDEATQRLRDAGFTNIRAVEASEEPASAKENTVLQVNPPSGSTTAASDQVTLTVATGRAVVPNLMGLTRKEAEDKARESGFTNLTFQLRQSPGVTPGTVFNTNPGADTRVAKSTKITVFVASDPAPTPTPTASPTPTPTPTASAEPTSPSPAPSASPTATP